MAEARRHHFVSQCYLKGFTHNGTKEGRLFVINVTDGASFETKPLKVAVERDFNAVEGRPQGELESKISEIESDLGAALDRVIKKRSIENCHDWHAVLKLFAFFAVRNPRFRNSLSEFAAETSKIALGISLSTRERWAAHVSKMKAAGVLDRSLPDIDYEQVKKFFDSGEYDIAIPRGYLIRQEFESIDVVLKTMVARNWTLISAEAETGGFITTDHPVCLTNGDGAPSSFQQPIGHGTKGSALIVPISKNLLAIGTFAGPSAVIRATRLQVALLNATVTLFAERQIYAAHDHFPILISGKLKPVSGADFAAYVATTKRESAGG